MEIINNTQADILETLARFKFLSTSQIKRLTGKSISYNREQIASLAERKYIKAYNLEKPARVENIYYLTEQGKSLLLENHKVFASDITIPKGVPLVVRDYTHRKHFIDVHIALYFYLKEKGIDIDTFHAYFDKTGDNRVHHNLESKTKLDLGNNMFFMPDGIMITDNNDNKEMYLIELYNGKDTGRIIDQLAKHGKAITNGSAAKKYGIQKNAKILVVMEYDRIRRAVIKRLETNERFKPISEYFYFINLVEVQENLIGNFKTIHERLIEFL